MRSPKREWPVAFPRLLRSVTVTLSRRRPHREDDDDEDEVKYNVGAPGMPLAHATAGAIATTAERVMPEVRRNRAMDLPYQCVPYATGYSYHGGAIVSRDRGPKMH